MRVKPGEAIYLRSRRKRWRVGYADESKLFNIVVFLNPAVRNMSYMDRLASDSSAKVYRQIETLRKLVINADRATAGDSPSVNPNVKQ